MSTPAEVVRQDAKLIAELGGPARLAEMLGYDKTAGGVQRVHNWIGRGIPARVKLAHAGVFLAASSRLGPATAGEG